MSRSRVLIGSVALITAAIPAIVTNSFAAQSQPCDPFTAPVVDDSVPTAEDVLGFPIGERDVTTEESDGYLKAVSAASPKVVDDVLATSVEGRPLRYAVVGQEKWVRPSALAKIGRDLSKLRDAQTPDALASEIIERTPAILWVAGNVHGGEESGTDASLRVLYELAARTDCAAEAILDKAIVVVLPTQNPDGREADTRRNAYGFDLNRDWFARTQVETDGKVEKLRELPPQLFIDAHEMGRATYFFPPNADPVYHDIGETPLDWIYNVYGTAMQDAFDRFGIPYFNGSVYDLLYMGYGDSAPTTGFNAAGMTFEKHNGDTTAVRVQEQYTAIWASLSAAAARDTLLEEWRAEYVTAYEQGLKGELEPNQLYWEGDDIENLVPTDPVRHYFIRTDDPNKSDEVQRLARRLQRMDIDVYRLVRPLRVPDFTAYGYPAQDTTLPVGTLWIPMAQGQKHWVQAMLHEDTYVPFPYFYDVTAWSGPLLNNVVGGRSGMELKPQAVPLAEQPEPAVQAVAGAPKVAVWQISQASSGSIESAGWLRWYFDNRLKLPYDNVSAADIGAGALDAVDVLVVPTGSHTMAANQLGVTGQEALRQWVQEGGRLVMLRDSARLAPMLGLTTAAYTSPTSDIPGSLIRVAVDASSPLAAGVGETAWAMYEYEFVWSAPSPASVPVRFPDEGDAKWFVSGFADGEEQLHGKAAVIDEAYGDGRVVLFGFDPNYRAFTDGTAKMLRNAVLGPDPVITLDAAAAGAQATAVDAVGASDRLVLSVRPGAVKRVEALLERFGATADIVRGPGVVSYRVDLGGLPSDEHPWAHDIADSVADLGQQVVAIRLP